MKRISTSPRYVTDINGPNPLSFRELGGGSNSEKLEKIGVFNLRTVDQLLMKFDN